MEPVFLAHGCDPAVDGTVLADVSGVEDDGAEGGFVRREGEEEGGEGEEVGEVWAAEVEGREGVVGEGREKLEEVEVVLRWRGREGVR